MKFLGFLLAQCDPHDECSQRWNKENHSWLHAVPEMNEKWNINAGMSQTVSDNAFVIYMNVAEIAEYSHKGLKQNICFI